MGKTEAAGEWREGEKFVISFFNDVIGRKTAILANKARLKYF